MTKGQKRERRRARRHTVTQTHTDIQTHAHTHARTRTHTHLHNPNRKTFALRPGRLQNWFSSHLSVIVGHTHAGVGASPPRSEAPW